MPEIPEFMFRVKLPNPNGYASCPSGDTDYEVAYNKVLREALPVGFEYIYPRAGQYWPVDSEGFTFARLRCTDEQRVVGELLEENGRLKKQLKELKDTVAGI